MSVKQTVGQESIKITALYELPALYRNVNRLIDTNGMNRISEKTAENEGFRHIECCWNPLFAFGAGSGSMGTADVNSHSGHKSDPAVAVLPPSLVQFGPSFERHRSMNGDKPTWTLVAHVGIIGHDRVLVSLAAPHFINGIIRENKTLSINIVDEGILPQADYSGSVSGAKTDKSNLFGYEIGEAGPPIIQKSPLVMECVVVDEIPDL